MKNIELTFETFESLIIESSTFRREMFELATKDNVGVGKAQLRSIDSVAKVLALECPGNLNLAAKCLCQWVGDNDGDISPKRALELISEYM